MARRRKKLDRAITVAGRKAERGLGKAMNKAKLSPKLKNQLDKMVVGGVLRFRNPRNTGRMSYPKGEGRG